MQYGGDLIGKGTYGCVYDPPVKCKKDVCENKQCTGRVSKVMSMKAAIDELKQIINIDRIDPSNEYHIGNPKICNQIDFSQEEKNQCDVSMEHPVSLYYEFGGIPFDKIDHNSGEKIFRAMGNLFKGIVMFNHSGFIHNDIKEPNIMYN